MALIIRSRLGMSITQSRVIVIEKATPPVEVLATAGDGASQKRTVEMSGAGNLAD